MKKIILLFISIAFTLFLTNSCKKSDISGDAKTLVEGAYLTLTATTNDSLDYKNITTSTVSYTVDGYGVPIESVNVYVVQGQSLDATTWKLIKNLPFTPALVISVTGTDIATALGIPATSINTDLTIYTEVVTKDGRKFSSANTPTNFTSLPGYNFAFSLPVLLINYVCPYDQSYFTGTFNIVSDGWNDYAAGAGIAVVGGPGTNQITLTLYPAPGVGTNRKNIIANVDPLTDSLSVPLQVFGDYPGDPNFACQGVGTLSACSGIISLSLDFSSPADGDFGVYKVVMKKQ